MLKMPRMTRDGMVLKTVQVSARPAPPEQELVVVAGDAYRALASRIIWKKEPDRDLARERIARLIQGDLSHFGAHAVTGDPVWTLDAGAGPLMVFIGDRMRLLTRDALMSSQVLEAKA